MKTALLFSGFTRGLQHARETIKKHLINNFGECDCYFYITDDPQISYFSWNYENSYKSIQELNAVIEYGENISSKCLDKSKHYCPRVYNQWHNLFKVKNMMLRSNIKYDFVIRIRPDTFFKSSIHPNDIDLNKINVSPTYSWGGINDKLAIGSFDNMIKYCNFFDSDYLSDRNLGKNSETRLANYLRNLNLSISHISFDAALVNEAGTLRSNF